MIVESLAYRIIIPTYRIVVAIFATTLWYVSLALIVGEFLIADLFCSLFGEVVFYVLAISKFISQFLICLSILDLKLLKYKKAIIAIVMLTLGVCLIHLCCIYIFYFDAVPLEMEIIVRLKTDSVKTIALIALYIFWVLQIQPRNATS